eukprot:CAMPEP_0177749270 /NCGR_PEP_ID=MMETSP0484_2-20121128/32395_1 /TAXON_ID=354590 /ORGANISM="Rhodomonas lens, Strain RHODO" /LENGTH=307 /DNA_ID=CAMNT_0019264239 /DNA_START=173 /DNA_END=1093 /DNA_ORIENTATION=+
MAASIVQGVVDRYLRKWVKNATTEHAGLWEGELVFKNVELRLDVMQQELGLPMVFTRGFIQELRVYLPLANILRENIRITLSNVEVVARTPNTSSKDEASEEEAEQASEPNGESEAATEGGNSSISSSSKKGEEAEKSKGWVASTLTKIMQNVRVDLRNVVFKYCTDKYVSSLSWKSLSYYPCSPSWEPRFTEPVGPTRARYKVLLVEHATWCLDPVDKDGVVASYVSPFFNRESLEIRIISRGKPDGDAAGPAPLQLPASQIDARFEAFELSVSDRQVAMLAVLIEEIQGMVKLVQDQQGAKKRRR